MNCLFSLNKRVLYIETFFDCFCEPNAIKNERIETFLHHFSTDYAWINKS